MTAWYEESFGKDYMIVYKHRDMQGAAEEVKRMIEWLKLAPGASVFDLCCGMGRHSLALDEAGYKVTGMDLSEVLLAEAHRLDPEGRVTWLRGDMRNVPATGPFDAVVNLFTSFGYFDAEAENVKVLQEIDRLLADGGQFIIDFLNPDYVIRHLVPYSERTDEGLRIVEERSIEDGCVIKRITISEPGRPDRNYKEQVKLFRLADFERMLAQTGLTIERVYGDYDGSALDPETSRRQILVGSKTGGRTA